jgi:hypothetical protein
MKVEAPRVSIEPPVSADDFKLVRYDSVAETDFKHDTGATGHIESGLFAMEQCPSPVGRKLEASSAFIADDEGYKSFTTSPEGQPENDLADDTETFLVQHLASLQATNVSMAEPIENSFPKAVKEAVSQVVSQAQQAATERSRYLREQAIKRKHVDPALVNQNSTNMSEEAYSICQPSPDLTTTTTTTTTAIPNMMVAPQTDVLNLSPSANEPDIEELLDIAQASQALGRIQAGASHESQYV